MQKKSLYILLGVAALIAVGFIFMGRSVGSGESYPTPMPTVTSTPENSKEIVGEWTWSKTTMSDGAITTPNKDVFVATFNSDGNMSSTTDCNSLFGPYKLTGENNGIGIGPLASTMMFCEGSQESVYGQQLQQVNSYKVSGNELWLMLPYDSGTMVFTKV